MMEGEASPRSRARKRDHDSFEELAELETPCSVPSDFEVTMMDVDVDLDGQAARVEGEGEVEGDGEVEGELGSEGEVKRDPSPARSSTGSLTDAGSVTPPGAQSPASANLTLVDANKNAKENKNMNMNALEKLDGNAAPPAKKTKLSVVEREARRVEKLCREKAKAEERARREAEREAERVERARREGEREAERKRREVEREERRVAGEVEKAAKEEKRRRKEEERVKMEEEKKRKEEEKRKKERSQLKLGNYFNIPATARQRGASVESRGRSSMSPAPSSALAVASPAPTAATTPSKPEQTPYEKLFPEFFVKHEVTLAPFSRFERDEEALETIQKSIDGYILGNQSPGRQRPFEPTALFHLSDLVPRGKRLRPVREIMTEFYSGNASKPIDLTTDSQNSRIKRTGDLLRKIPMKLLQFQEDVRPPYRGTYTSRPVTGMTKLARNPMRRDLPDTNYDYDSEAEWQEDEDAEDLKSEGDEEEEADDDEDMEGFLDDENDETANSRRLVLQGDLEPISTGLCWEDRKKRNTNVKMIAYRMEIILDPSLKSIDPFSKAYWEPIPTTMEPPRIPLNTMKNTSVNVNTNTTKPVKPFFTTASDLKPSPSQTTLIPPPSHPLSAPPPSTTTKPKKLLKDEDMPAFRAAVQDSNLSKLGLIEVLKKQFPGRSGAVIKATLEAVARREGVKEVDKRWRIVQ